MMYPQDYAKRFFNGACLALCYLYCSNRKIESDLEASQIVLEALKTGLLDDDGTVKDGEGLLNFYDGKNYKVEKKEINSIVDIKKPTPVRYDAYGYTPHWVVVENGKIVFNPLLNSNSVNKGRPVTARIISKRS